MKLPSWVKKYYVLDELPEGEGILKRNDETGEFYFEPYVPEPIIPTQEPEPEPEPYDPVYDELAAAYMEGVNQA